MVSGALNDGSADPSAPVHTFLVKLSRARDDKLILRPEHDEWELLKQHPELYDAALIPAAYAAEYPEENAHGGRGGSTLVEAVPAEREYWLDPYTACVTSKSWNRLKPTSRLRSTAVAKECAPPVAVAAFAADSALFDDRSDVIAQSQVGSTSLVPFYFDVDRLDSAALRLNLRAARRALESVADQTVTSVISVTRHRVTTGLLAALAAEYSALAVPRVLIRARGFDTRDADATELDALADAIEAYVERGIETILDFAGSFGPVAIALGATGFATGTRFFQSPPQALMNVGGGGGGAPIPVQQPGTFREQERPENVSAHEARIGNLRNLRANSRLAVTAPRDLVEVLRRSQSAHTARWARVLAARLARAA